VIVQANYVVPSESRSSIGNRGLRPSSISSNGSAGAYVVSENMAKQLEQQIIQALNVYLNFTNRIDRDWDITLKLTSEQSNLFATNGQIAEITGGQIPFTGRQQFRIRMQTDVTVVVDAMVTLPMEVVIVRRSLPKGYIISESDVMLRRLDKMNGEDFFVDIKDVVGKETVRAVRELSPVVQSLVRLPYLVRRGDVVTVRGMNGGIVVRREAVALQDGVEGETIMVTNVDLMVKRGRGTDSAAYRVRVCGPKTVEVFVQ
jgi:flagella basal body P-ring formation protein FlgA